MCGINGIVHFDNSKVEKKLLELMNEKMIHRGPDEDGFFVENNIGFSMRRLSILGVEDSHQPQFSEDEDIVVVFNGEIYNFIELKEELSEKGHRFKTSGDTEVLVHLYQEYGINFLDKLNGMFAFALFDKSKKKIFVTRDRLGIKPLYYLNNAGVFSFSSDLNSLVEGNPKFDFEVNDDSFVQYMSQTFINTPKTIFNDVTKINTGCYLEIDLKNQKINERNYWSLREFDNENSSEEEVVSNIKSIMKSAIQFRMRSDVPIGTFLSGGLDSSTIVGMLDQELPENTSLNTFSVGFEGGENELPLAKLVSDKYQTNHYEKLITDKDVLESLDEITSLMDEPFFDNAMVPTYILSKVARENGIKVILNGTGGDEIFGGYTRYHPYSKVHNFIYYGPQFLRTLCSILLKPWNANKALMMKNNELFYLAQLSGTNFSFLENMVREKGEFQHSLKKVINHYRPYFKESYSLGKKYPIMKMDLENYLVDDILNLLDKMTMGTSIEGRVPFLDHRLVEYMYRVKDQNRYSGGLKGLMKKVFSHLLPKKLVDEKKKGFGGPTKHWFNGELNELVYKELCLDTNDYFKKYFIEGSIEKIFDNKKVKPEFIQTSFGLYIFSLWYKKFSQKRNRV